MHGPSSEQNPLYHFRVFTNGIQHHEPEPLGFDDLKDVWQEGAMSACEIIRAMHGRIDDRMDWRLDVSDDTGRVIYRFSFKAERL